MTTLTAQQIAVDFFGLNLAQRSMLRKVLELQKGARTKDEGWVPAVDFGGSSRNQIPMKMLADLADRGFLLLQPRGRFNGRRFKLPEGVDALPDEVVLIFRAPQEVLGALGSLPLRERQVLERIALFGALHSNNVEDGGWVDFLSLLRYAPLSSEEEIWLCLHVLQAKGWIQIHGNEHLQCFKLNDFTSRLR